MLLRASVSILGTWSWLSATTGKSGWQIHELAFHLHFSPNAGGLDKAFPLDQKD